jgi:hypothetical protein
LAGKMGIYGAFWRETKLMAGNYPSVADIVGPFDVSRVFVSSGVPRARLGKPGMPWARRMDESPNSSENEEPGARLGRIPPSG